MQSGKQEANNMWTLIKHLEAVDELIEDRASLRHMGLSEEEIDGYEEFFFRNYFPNDTEEV